MICEANQMLLDYEVLTEAELVTYNERTEQDLDFDEFCEDCAEGNVHRQDLKDLPELTDILDCHIILDAQRQAEIEMSDDLPF